MINLSGQIKSILFILFSTSVLPAQAQLGYAEKKYADAKNAIEIKDSVVGPLNVAYGYGELREWTNKKDPFTQEINSIWLTFTATCDTLLTFDIVPIDSFQDYDFAVFKYYSKASLDSLNKSIGKPLRGLYTHCLARKAVTGLSEHNVVTEVLGNGTGTPYVAAIPMLKGERYYIMVNFTVTDWRNKSYIIPKGFHIYFYNYWPPKQPVVLKNVLFETNKAVLLKSSWPELNQLAARMEKNAGMYIEIRGHTDNEGLASDNLLLSQNRAKAIRDYLVSKGISDDRLKYRGFGQTQPVANNATEDGRKKNRRVEFTVLFK